MDKYYVCRDYMNDFYKITVEDNYYDAVIAAAVYAKKNAWNVAVIHGTDVIYRAKP